MKIVLLNKSLVIEHSSGFDYRSFSNRTFDCVRLAKFYCGFDYVRLSSAIKRVVFDWVQLTNCSIRYPGKISKLFAAINCHKTQYSLKSGTHFASVQYGQDVMCTRLLLLFFLRG